MGGLWIAVASLTFWTQERGSGLFPVFYNTINFARYPLTIYPAAVRFMLTFVLPYGFIAFYPAVAVLREEYSRVGWMTLPTGVLVLVFGLWVWRQGLARYEGSGS